MSYDDKQSHRHADQLDSPQMATSRRDSTGNITQVNKECDHADNGLIPHEPSSPQHTLLLDVNMSGNGLDVAHWIVHKCRVPFGHNDPVKIPELPRLQKSQSTQLQNDEPSTATSSLSTFANCSQSNRQKEFHSRTTTDLPSKHDDAVYQEQEPTKKRLKMAHRSIAAVENEDQKVQQIDGTDEIAKDDQSTCGSTDTRLLAAKNNLLEYQQTITETETAQNINEQWLIKLCNIQGVQAKEQAQRVGIGKPVVQHDSIDSCRKEIADVKIPVADYTKGRDDIKVAVEKMSNQAGKNEQQPFVFGKIETKVEDIDKRLAVKDEYISACDKKIAGLQRRIHLLKNPHDENCQLRDKITKLEAREKELTAVYIEKEAFLHHRIAELERLNMESAEKISQLESEQDIMHAEAEKRIESIQEYISASDKDIPAFQQKISDVIETQGQNSGHNDKLRVVREETLVARYTKEQLLRHMSIKLEDLKHKALMWLNELCNQQNGSEQSCNVNSQAFECRALTAESAISVSKDQDDPTESKYATDVKHCVDKADKVLAEQNIEDAISTVSGDSQCGSDWIDISDKEGCSDGEN